MFATKRLSAAAIIAATLIIAGCTPTTDVSRDIGFAPAPARAPVAAVAMQNWSFAELQVVVPRSLSVSEAHGYKPRADIVWREDALGDRHEQVRALMDSALRPALAPMAGDVPVRVTLEVTRFHALTERARYSIGGEHEIEFTYTVRHAETGALLAGPTPVDLTFRGLGGRQAVEAEAQGITQRVRITERLVGWAQQTFGASYLGASPAS